MSISRRANNNRQFLQIELIMILYRPVLRDESLSQAASCQ